MKKDREFRGFFESFFIPVCRFVERYTKNEDASDIAQEVFVKVYEKWADFETMENAKAFLYTVAHNASIDYVKSRRVREAYAIAYEKENTGSEDDFLKEVTRQETFRILYAAIDRLPGQARQVMRLSVEGYSVQEVGERMGISVNTVKTLKKNAYEALRTLLPKECLAFVILLLEGFQQQI